MSKNELSDEDRALFRQMMGSVKPLRPQKDRIMHKKTDNVLPVIKRRPVDAPKKTEIYTFTHHSSPVQAESVLSYYRNALQPTHRREFEKGKMPRQGQLDLHGYKIDQACQVLCDFIAHHHARTQRSLLIVHGKGGQHGETPILKNHVNDWLQQIPEVLAFHSAQPRDGGCGAVYVLLMKHQR